MKLLLKLNIISVCLLNSAFIQALDHEKILASMTELGKAIYREHLEIVRYKDRPDNGWRPEWYLKQQPAHDQKAKKLLNMWYLPNRSNESSPSSSTSSYK